MENRQIAIFFCAVAAAGIVATVVTGTVALEAAINTALALMLYFTLLQVPVAALKHAVGQLRFLAALLTANSVVVPLLVRGGRHPAEPGCAVVTRVTHCQQIVTSARQNPSLLLVAALRTANRSGRHDIDVPPG